MSSRDVPRPAPDSASAANSELALRPLAAERNLGPRSAEMLAAAGIVERSQLEEMGAVAAYLATLQAGAKPHLNLLWAIHGALTDTAWNELSPATREQLRRELKLWTRGGGER